MDVEAALAALPVDQRAALVLVDLQGFSVEQAAAVLECPAGTVKSRCFRGRAQLARLLVQYGPGNPDDTPRVSSQDHQDGA
jgi:RNA polymerase sigma-70 factor (ECF subfamily)